MGDVDSSTIVMELLIDSHCVLRNLFALERLGGLKTIYVNVVNHMNV